MITIKNLCTKLNITRLHADQIVASMQVQVHLIDNQERVQTADAIAIKNYVHTLPV